MGDGFFQGPTFVMGRHFESTKLVKDWDEGRALPKLPFHTVPLSMSAIFFTRLSPLLVSISKMSADKIILYQTKNTPGLYTKWDSFTPRRYKVNLKRTFTFR